MNNEIKELRLKLERLKANKENVLSTIKEIKIKIKKEKEKSLLIEEAQEIVKNVANQTQNKLKYNISELVSLALVSVFGEKAYNFDISFQLSRGNSSAIVSFVDKDGNLLDPLDSTGGGACDIAAFALRISFWNMMKKRSRNIFILDEPFKHLRGQYYQNKASEMIKKISDKLGIQVLIISDVNFSIMADKIFETEQISGITKIIEK